MFVRVFGAHEWVVLPSNRDAQAQGLGVLDAQQPLLVADRDQLQVHLGLLFAIEELLLDGLQILAAEVMDLAHQIVLTDGDAATEHATQDLDLLDVAHALLGESWRGRLGEALARPHRLEITVTLAVVVTTLGRKVAFSQELDQRDQHRLAREEPPSEVKEQRMLRHGSPLS